MMAAGAIDGPQVIAPSSNDWDYTFDGGGEWPVAGNTLGDHTIGGYIDNIGGDSALGSLITFDGDFEVEFTFTGIQHSAFGVHALTDDDHRTTEQYLGAKAMTNSFSWIEAGSNPKDFFIGSTAQSDTHTFATGSVVKIERVSGTITIYDDDVSVHVFGTTYSGAMRVWFGAGGAPFTSDLDNILFTDTDKIQRDGFFNEGTIAISEWGDLFGANYARRITATRTGTVGTVVLNITLITTSFDAVCQIYSDDGTSPASIIGSASDTVNIGATGDKTFTFASLPEVVKGTTYWVVFSDTTLAGTGRVTPGGLTQSGLPENQRGCGRHGTITSITDNEVAPTLKMEMRINATGEPIPDHDTILLIHSDTSDSSTTFVDSSQNGFTVTTNGNAQHDTAQALGFGTSSILFDGTGDYLEVANQAPFSDMAGAGFINLTAEAIIRLNATPSGAFSIMAVGNGATNTGMLFSMFVSSSRKLNGVMGNNGGAGVHLSGATALAVGTDYHVALIKTGTDIRLYVDGVSDASTTSSLTFSSSLLPLTIGTDARRNTNWFNGWIKEPRFSANSRWDANFTPPTSAYP